MTVMERTVEPHNDVERLVCDLFALGDVAFTLAAGDGYSVAELTGIGRPFFYRGWWAVETEAWHIHAQVHAVKRIRFVREPSKNDAGQESLTIRLLGPKEESLLRCYFLKLYDDANAPIPEAFARWGGLRAKYGGQDEVSVENGQILALAPA